MSSLVISFFLDVGDVDLVVAVSLSIYGFILFVCYLAIYLPIWEELWKGGNVGKRFMQLNLTPEINFPVQRVRKLQILSSMTRSSKTQLHLHLANCRRPQNSLSVHFVESGIHLRESIVMCLCYFF